MRSDIHFPNVTAFYDDSGEHRRYRAFKIDDLYIETVQDVNVSITEGEIHTVTVSFIAERVDLVEVPPSMSGDAGRSK